MSRLEAASTGVKQRKTLLQNLVEHYETLVRNTEAEVDSIAHVLEARSTKLTEEVERLTQEIADLKEQKACMSCSSLSFSRNSYIYIIDIHRITATAASPTLKDPESPPQLHKPSRTSPHSTLSGKKAKAARQVQRKSAAASKSAPSGDITSGPSSPVTTKPVPAPKARKLKPVLTPKTRKSKPVLPEKITSTRRTRSQHPKLVKFGPREEVVDLDAR